jgi:sulfate adenylyltransferase large subunit/phosphoadenylyl-sulfate reductase (thioredoxin)
MTIAVSPHLRPAAVAPSRPLVRIVIVGHVDHGKSTLIGRLLHETGSLPDGKLETLKAVSARRGMKFEWSFLLDALQTERDQGITIDTSQIHFRTAARDFVLIDAPGHAEFLRNMITGAAQADAALLIVDAAEGVRDQTRRHGYLLHLLGVRQVAVVINKMDRIGFDAERFREIEAEITAHLAGLGLTPTAVIPISARHGDGVARRTDAIAWHDGPTVLAALDAFAPARRATDLPLRFPVQAIYKFDDRRIVAGRVESGRVAVDDEIVVMPGEKRARVRTIEAWPVPDAGDAPHAATAGQSIGITLDRELFVERGNVIALAATPPTAAKRLKARVFWLDPRPLAVGGEITARIGTAASRAVVRAIENALDPGLLASDGAEVIGPNHVGEIELELAQPLAVDPHAADAAMGRLVLDFDGRIAGGGLVLAVTPFQDHTQSSPAGLTRGSIQTARSFSRSGWMAGSSPAMTEERVERATILAQQLAPLSPAERIARLRHELAGKIVFTTSFGLEDQAILHLIAEHGRDFLGGIEVATLDTGRLFPETHALWADTERRYGIRIRALHPRHDDLEALVARQGINGFYESRAARVACCQVRKIEPLGRALAGAQGWIAGLRAEQSAHRRDMALVSAERGLIKLNPLFDWSRTQLEAFVAAHDIPVNPLHDKGFASIGCAPCTRPIAPGEPERAGRWWWEQDEKTECGLHVRT